MRLAEDSSSWKSSGIQRRDFRAAQDEFEEPTRVVSKKKNTKKWCKGKVGVEHNFQMQNVYLNFFTYSGHAYNRYVCENCGKVKY